MTHTPLVARDARVKPSKSPHGGAVAFRNILAGVDGTVTGRDAIALGEQLRDRDGQLTLAHIVPAQARMRWNFRSTARPEQVRDMLEQERAAADLSAELTEVFASSVGSGLHQLAHGRHADLLVVGSCSRGPIGRLLRGDDTRGSLSGASCAVAIAPHGYSQRFRSITTIGVAYDGEPESEIALAAARTLGARHGAAVRALTVVTPDLVAAASRRQTLGNSALTGATIRGTTNVGPALTAASWSAAVGRRWATTSEALERAARERLQAMADVEPRVSVGSLHEELLAFADQVDLLVTGSRGHRSLRRLFLGSTSAYLARSARCPLLVLPRAVAVRGGEVEA